MGSKSSQSQTSNFTDERAVLGEGSILAREGSNVSTYNRTTNYALDNGAIDGAFGFANDAGAGALSVVSDAVRQVLNFAGDAQAGSLSTATGALSKAFTFGADALGFGGQALAANQVNIGRVLDATADTQQLVATAYEDAKGRGALTDKILIGTVLGALAVAALAVKKG